MKAHHFSIIFAVIMMVLFVQPNKVNMNLKTDEVIEKVEKSHEGIQSFVQNTTLTSSYIRRKTAYLSNEISYRLEHRKNNGSPLEYLSGSKKFIDEEMVSAYFFLHLQPNESGYFSECLEQQTRKEFNKAQENPEPKKEKIINYGPWEKKPSMPNEIMSYSTAVQEFNRLAPIMEKQEGDSNYIFSLEKEDFSMLDEGDHFYLGLLLKQLEIDKEKLLSTEWDKLDFRIRFVIERENMRIQNVSFSIHTKRGAQKYTLQYNTDYEQFNIVGEPRISKSAPALP